MSVETVPGLTNGTLLHDPAKHEALRALPWDEGRVREAIARIVADTEARFSTDTYWPHPLERKGNEAIGRIETPLYHGACGIIWALNYLDAVGAAALSRTYVAEFDRLLARNRAWLGDAAERDRGSFMDGDTPIRMLAFGIAPTDELEGALETLIEGNFQHPARELMWGSPGTMLAAWFLFQRTGKNRWAELFRANAEILWSQLEWSPEYRCFHWTQHFGGRTSTYLGAVHGFVGAAAPLIRGRHLLPADTWDAWERRIVETVMQTADRVGDHANWRAQLDRAAEAPKKLLQICHGAPGFVVGLADLPNASLDELLLAAGETIWSAGPLAKGSNLCHGTGGNGYAFLKLYRRTGDVRWLERARAFAMHGIAQTFEDFARRGRMRDSLWTGDLGFAIYLWDCLRAQAQFPTIDVFYATPAQRSA